MTSLIGKRLEWNVAETKVALFSEGESLIFSVTNGDEVVQRERIPLRLYAMGYALSLAELFHQTIEQNLQTEIHASCFLPILCTDALKLQNGRYTPITNLRVAIFARINRAAHRVLWVFIGIIDESTGEGHYFCPDNTGNTLTEFFLLNSPQYNQPNADKRRNYEMSSYVKQFRVVVKYEDTTDVLESMGLTRVSLFNRNVVLDEKNWAVTLLSAASGSECHSVGNQKQFGHAMIAIEYPSDDRSLLYAHITTKDNPEYPDLANDQAYVDIFRREPSSSIAGAYGPTWSLPRDQVQCLIHIIDREKELCRAGHLIKFAKIGTARGIAIDKLVNGLIIVTKVAKIAFHVVCTVNGYNGTFIQLIGLSILGLRPEPFGGYPNCADWCLSTLEKVQIVFNIPTINELKATPNQLIEYLKEHPEAVSI